MHRCTTYFNLKQKRATDTLTLSDPSHFRLVRRAPLERDTKRKGPETEVDP